MFSKPTARALAILDLLVANPHQAIGLTEMTRRLNLNKATCHAILSTMSKYGFLVQDPRSKAYRLGPSLVAAGNAANSRFPVLEYARPELEGLTSELGFGCGASGRTKNHVVLLSLYGRAEASTTPFRLGMRIPNAAPLGSSFIAWSPAKQLESWLAVPHQQRGMFDEKLDKRLRLSIVTIRARGYEVTLHTQAEDRFMSDLRDLNECWTLEALDEISSRYQQGLCDEPYFLDKIDKRTRYSVTNIAVPVFGRSNTPELVFTCGTFQRDLRGDEIIHVAKQLHNAAKRVTQAARGHQRTEL